MAKTSRAYTEAGPKGQLVKLLDVILLKIGAVENPDLFHRCVKDYYNTAPEYKDMPAFTKAQECNNVRRTVLQDSKLTWSNFVRACRILLTDVSITLEATDPRTGQRFKIKQQIISKAGGDAGHIRELGDDDDSSSRENGVHSNFSAGDFAQQKTSMEDVQKILEGLKGVHQPPPWENDPNQPPTVF